MPRNPIEKCEVTWEDQYGTTSSGNLPTHKTKECVEDVVDLPTIQATFSWIDISDFHFYHIKCPFSDEADFNYIRNIIIGSANYWQMELVLPADRVNHVNTGGMMIKYSRGSKHGWLCVDPVCKYYLGTTALGSVTSGLNYFYY